MLLIFATKNTRINLLYYLYISSVGDFNKTIELRIFIHKSIRKSSTIFFFIQEFIGGFSFLTLGVFQIQLNVNLLA